MEDVDSAREPLLAGNLLDQLIANVRANSHWWSPRKRRAAINVLKAHWMRSGNPFEERGRESEQTQAFLDVMDQHFSQKDILDVLKYTKGPITNYGAFRNFSLVNRFELEANRPNIRKVTQKIDHELLEQFNLGDAKTVSAVVQKIDELTFQGLTVTSTDKNGSTLLHKLLQQVPADFPDDVLREVFRRFKGHGADFNAKDGNGNTPLHIAEGRGLTHVTGMLIEGFGAAPELANNKLITVSDIAFSKTINGVERSEHLNGLCSYPHVAIELHAVDQFEDEVLNGRINIQHPQLGTPIKYLQYLIRKYEAEKKVHSPRQWWRQQKLKQMLEFYLNNLAQQISNDRAKPVPNANLIAEFSDLSDANRDIVIRNAVIIYAFPEERQALRDRYLGAPPPQVPAAGNNNNDVAPAPAVVSRSVVRAAKPEVAKDPVAELQSAFKSFDVHKQPVEDLLTLLNALKKLTPKQIEDVLNSEKSEYYNLYSSIQSDCNIRRIKLWEEDYAPIWKVLLKVTEKRDQNASLEQAVSANFTTEVVRLINDRKVKIDHGVAGKMKSTLLTKAVNNHNVVAIELLLTHGAVVTFAEFRPLFLVTKGHDDQYLAEGARINDLLQAKFALVKWPAAEIRAVLIAKYEVKNQYFSACELQALFSGLSRITPDERESILSREVRAGGYNGESRRLGDWIQANVENCEKQRVANLVPQWLHDLRAARNVGYVGSFDEEFKAVIQLRRAVSADNPLCVQDNDGTSIAVEFAKWISEGLDQMNVFWFLHVLEDHFTQIQDKGKRTRAIDDFLNTQSPEGETIAQILYRQAKVADSYGTGVQIESPLREKNLSYRCSKIWKRVNAVEGSPASSRVAPQSAFHAPASPVRSPESERKSSQEHTKQDGSKPPGLDK